MADARRHGIIRHDRAKMAAIFQSIFFKENVWISIKVSLKFIPNSPISDIPALVQKITYFVDAYMRHAASTS